MPKVLQACLNGSRPRSEHPAVPVAPAELAAAARAAVDAGADELHVHPRGADERDTLEPGPVAGATAAIRATCPGVPLGLTTGIWAAGGDARRRLELVAAWDELPDYVSVNLSEPGFAELCDLVTGRGMGIEAGAWSTEDAAALAVSRVECLRVLVEPASGGAEDQLEAARRIERALREVGIAPPQLHHGAGAQTWRVLAAARQRGHDVRIGLEDTTVLPDGSTARDNAELVAAAL
ncbi:MAG: 3-keto-5-aminohexanoate cleavage protein [Thermoleophilaceae bacterium]|nr:3-keto-5-aminohexanoate cleavage protein [Thermoleophilaceae bacterium]